MRVSDTRPCVMQVVLSLDPGGTERLAIELARRLSDRFRMLVCCLDHEGAWAPELDAANIPVVALRRSPGFRPSLGAQLAALAREHGASIVHAHHYSPFVYSRIASLLNRRLALVFTEHGRLSDAPPTRKRRAANALLARCPGAVFAVSHALKTHMVAEGFAAERVGVIHNGIDEGTRPTPADRGDARARLGVPEDAFLIGTAARLDPVKDLGTLIAATAALRGRVPAARLVIMGEGPEQASLQMAARDAGVHDAVTFAGHRADVRELLAAFDVYVNSSISEGISLTILEAMAAGLPVVATAVGGTPEVIRDGATGVLVPARDPGALTETLAGLHASAERRATLGAAARTRLEQAFTLDRMTADYAREYGRLERR